VRPRKDSVAAQLGIKGLGNPDTLDHCENQDIQPVSNRQLGDSILNDRSDYTDVITYPGRSYVDSLA
jgi:hypothetical protein